MSNTIVKNDMFNITELEAFVFQQPVIGKSIAGYFGHRISSVKNSSMYVFNGSIEHRLYTDHVFIRCDNLLICEVHCMYQKSPISYGGLVMGHCMENAQYVLRLRVLGISYSTQDYYWSIFNMLLATINPHFTANFSFINDEFFIGSPLTDATLRLYALSKDQFITVPSIDSLLTKEQRAEKSEEYRIITDALKEQYGQPAKAVDGERVDPTLPNRKRKHGPKNQWP